MPCFANDADTPWTYHVVYDIPTSMLEVDVQPLKDRSQALRTTLQCKANGDDALLRTTYQETPPLDISVGKYATLRVSMDRQCTTRNYIKKATNFTKICVEARKTFVFQDLFEWRYTFLFKYREPYYDTQDLMKDIVDKDIVFRDPPVCIFQLSCGGVKDTTDHGYFADSLLCKLSDLFPPAWKMEMLQLK